jgi:adenylylsulfate kinase
MKTTSENVVWHQATVTRLRREQKNQHKGALFWFTGLSGAGKSTLAHAVEERLFQQGYNTYVLDGDNVRHGLCADLGFSDEDRTENIRRIGQMSNLFVQAGVIVLTAFISPFRVDRQNARKIAGQDFHEIYCDCSLDICEQRDVKGLYKKARAGKIPFFTGIDSPYEAPEAAELVTKTDENLDQSIDLVFNYILEKVKV